MHMVPPKHTPPVRIPEELYDDFTLNGKIQVLEAYFNDSASRAVHNKLDRYLRHFRRFEKRIFTYYDQEINSFYDAFADYDLAGKTVLVWGLVGCNCEALALWREAEAVYVVDYNKPICEHPRITTVTHEELFSLNIKFDYAISFSSFEHDGLGRYGDPVSPYADIKAMRSAKEVMADDGVLFFGAPLGQDALVWNAHRIYGPVRLPMLLQGWLPVNVYSVYCGEDIFSDPVGSHQQPLIALKKIPEESAPRQRLLESLEHAAQVERLTHPGTRDGKMLSQIVRMLL